MRSQSIGIGPLMNLPPVPTSFRTVSEFRELLADREDQFSRCLTEKLMTYALGRELDAGDRPRVDELLCGRRPICDEGPIAGIPGEASKD